MGEPQVSQTRALLVTGSIAILAPSALFHGSLGQRPRNSNYIGNQALKARFSLTEEPRLDETRFQRFYPGRFNFPGALPQAELICAVSAKQI